MRLPFMKNRKHRNVGKRIYSPYFDRELIITAYNNDQRWYYRFAGDPERREYPGKTFYSYYVLNGLVRRR